MSVKIVSRLFGIVRGGSSVRAIAFGVAAGLLTGLPPLGLLTLCGLVLFAVLNANLWTFLLAAAVGFAVQFLLPGVLHAVGHGLLETESLKGLWTSLLNLPGFALLGLDHYVSMGGAALAVLLGLGAVVAGIVLFKKRGATGDERRDKRESRWIRRGFVWPSVIVAVLAIVGFWFGGDSLARTAVKLAAGQGLQKDVSVSNARLGVLGGSLEIEELAVREPAAQGEEIASGKKFTFDLSMLRLLNRRFVVDKLSAENLMYRARPEDMPTVPEPPAGKPTSVADVLNYIEANEEQIRWAVEQLTTFLESAGKPSTTPSPTNAYAGRAAYVYAGRTDPMGVIREAGIENLQFDWGETTGPLTKLKNLTLVAKNLSSNPSNHEWPIFFEGNGAYGKGALRLAGRFDVRKASSDPHTLDLGFTSETFGRVAALGLTGGKNLALAVATKVDPKTFAFSSAQATGQFSAIGAELVQFTLGLGGDRNVELKLKGFDVEKAAGIKMPEMLKLNGGVLDVTSNFALNAGKLAGTFGVSANGLRIAPGSAREIAGVPADKFCAAINALAGGAPLTLGFKLGGTKNAPALSMETEQLYALLDQVKTGLVKVGEQALASEVNKRLGALAAKGGGKLAALQQKAAAAQQELQKKLGEQVSGVQGKIGEKLSGVQQKANQAIGGATKKLEEDLKKKAGGILGGLLGGKKKK